MVRMIDTEQAWKTAQKVFSDPVLLHAIRVVLDKAHTVDTAKVVRCEDCKHWESWETTCGIADKGYCKCHEVDAMEDDDFCSHGERRDKDAVD